VFEAILSNATRICEATYGNLLLWENGAFRRATQCNAPQELIEEFQSNPVFIPLRNNPLDRVLKTKETVHTVDAQAESNLGLLANARTLLNVPMLSHGDLIGTISIYRQEVRPFTEKHIALVENFAAQAVIAIENARLLNDLNKLNQQLEQRVADQVGEIERMSRLRRFLPPQVADLIVASGTEKQLESHRRAQHCSVTCAALPASRKAQTRKMLWRSWPSIMRPLARSSLSIPARSKGMRATGSWSFSMILFRSRILLCKPS
jgi:transcriptional regulator with GAF, ATPase, and Fis domain